MPAFVDRLFDVLDGAREELTYEERETVADALASEPRDGEPVSPRACEWLDRLREQLHRIKLTEGASEANYWTAATREAITEPTDGKGADEMNADEIDRELERRRKYVPPRRNRRER